jgi:hypothetical protein
MSAPAVSLVDQIRALSQAAKVSFDQSAAPPAGDPTRAELIARLEAATDNDTRWKLAEAINNLPAKNAF